MTLGVSALSMEMSQYTSPSLQKKKTAVTQDIVQSITEQDRESLSTHSDHI